MKDHYEKVKHILEQYPETRDDDMKLYSIFCYQESKVTKSVSFYRATWNHRDYDLPSYESVSRARRKVQESESSLQGKRRKSRKNEAEKYRKYYGGNHD